MVGKKNFFACFSCFRPDAVDAFNSSSPKTVQPEKSSKKDEIVPESSVNESEYIGTTSRPGEASSSSSVDDRSKLSNGSLSDNEQEKDQPPIETTTNIENVQKGKTQSDITSGLTPEQLEAIASEDSQPKHPTRAQVLSHPVPQLDWTLANSIASDEEEGEGRLSDYEC